MIKIRIYAGIKLVAVSWPVMKLGCEVACLVCKVRAVRACVRASCCSYCSCCSICAMTGCRVSANAATTVKIGIDSGIKLIPVSGPSER